MTSTPEAKNITLATLLRWGLIAAVLGTLTGYFLVAPML